MRKREWGREERQSCRERKGKRKKREKWVEFRLLERQDTACLHTGMTQGVIDSIKSSGSGARFVWMLTVGIWGLVV